jgi:hypothetical protein
MEKKRFRHKRRQYMKMGEILECYEMPLLGIVPAFLIS